MVSGVFQIIGQHTVPALGIFLVKLMQLADQLLLFDFPGRDRVLQPLLVRLGAEPKYPARHRHFEYVSGLFQRLILG